MWPSTSKCSLTVRASCERNSITRRPKSPRLMICPLSCPAPKKIRVPGGNFLPGLTSASQVFGAISRDRRTSIAALGCGFRCEAGGPAKGPASRKPKRRAGITRALLNTSNSSPRKRLGNSAKWRSLSCPSRRSIIKSRAPSRCSGGYWAMDVAGS